jgi:PAS domain S-box-containing protein
VGIRLRDGDNYPYYASIGFSEKHLSSENCLCSIDSSGKQLYHPDNQLVLDCMCGDVICRRFDPAKSHFTEGGSFWINSSSEFVASATSAEQASKIRDCCKSEGYESVALIPLNANNVTIGLLQFNDLRRDRFTVDVILFFEDLAQSIGIALAQKQAEESLVTSESSYRRLFESAKDGILIINALNGVVTDANPYLTDLLGVSPHELINMVLWEINVFKGIVSSKQDFQELLQKGYVRYEDLPLKTDDGRKISVEFVSNVYEVEHRKVVQCNIRDISERKLAGEEKQRLEEKAQVASRLAAMGEMAAGIAHEINNPLTGVLGYSQMMLSKENVPEDIKGDLKLIADNSRRVAEIVKRLLTFARQAKPVKTLVNLNELVDNTLKLRDYVLKTAGIKVVKEFDPDLPLSVADAGQIQQVFLNLVVNAEQAMKTAHGQGTLTIITEKKENNIRILFKDDGPGITEENQTHLFEPFFTTKAQGEGTGLGLSLSRSIIMEHDGKLIVDSQFGHGATFIVELPILEAMPKAEETIVPAVQAPPLVTRKGKILVVDDEAVVRGVLQRVMTKMGHSVDVLSDAKTAMDKIEAGASYDVILTDVRMPGMSGIEMYSRIVARSSEMKKRIIFITGDVMGTDIKSFLTKNDLSYLAKPFDIDALKTKIDSIMSSF